MADLVKIPVLKTFSFVHQLVLNTGEAIALETGEGISVSG